MYPVIILQITQMLTDEGVLSPSGLDNCVHATVLRILKNPKYKVGLRPEQIQKDVGRYL